MKNEYNHKKTTLYEAIGIEKEELELLKDKILWALELSNEDIKYSEYIEQVEQEYKNLTHKDFATITHLLIEFFKYQSYHVQKHTEPSMGYI